MLAQKLHYIKMNEQRRKNMEKSEPNTIEKTKGKKDIHLQQFLKYKISQYDGPRGEYPYVFEDLKQQYVLFLLEITNYNLTETANILNISRKVSAKKLREEIANAFRI
jgi:hypothetical protein